MSRHGHKLGDRLSDAEVGAIAQEAGALLERTAQFGEEEQVQPAPARETIQLRYPDGHTAKMRAFRNPQFRRFFGIWMPTSKRIEACRKQPEAVIPAYLLRRRMPLSAG